MKSALRIAFAVWLSGCGGDETLSQPDATEQAAGACIDTENDDFGSDGLIFRPCDEIKDGVCTYKFLDGTGSIQAQETMTCRECLAKSVGSASELDQVCSAYERAR